MLHANYLLAGRNQSSPPNVGTISFITSKKGQWTKLKESKTLPTNTVDGFNLLLCRIRPLVTTTTMGSAACAQDINAINQWSAFHLRALCHR